MFNYLSMFAMVSHHHQPDCTTASAKVRVCVCVCVSQEEVKHSQHLLEIFYSQDCIITVNFSFIFVCQATDPRRILGYVFLSPTQAGQARKIQNGINAYLLPFIHFCFLLVATAWGEPPVLPCFLICYCLIIWELQLFFS